MLLTVNLQSWVLDLPTLSLVAVCIAGLLGLFLIIDWMQRNIRALAWWGSAYLIGASAMALGSMPTPINHIAGAVPGALTFLACGMVWNGVRLFQGRRVLPFATFIGAVLWLGIGQIPGALENGNGAILGALIVPVYTFFIAMELWRGAPPNTLFTCGSRRGAVLARRNLFWYRSLCTRSCRQDMRPHG